MQSLRKLDNNWEDRRRPQQKGDSQHLQPLHPKHNQPPHLSQLNPRRPRLGDLAALKTQRQQGERTSQHPQPLAIREEKNPNKNPGPTSVNPVEGDKESTDSDGNDTDALSHLPTDDESGAEDQGTGEVNGDTEEQ